MKFAIGIVIACAAIGLAAPAAADPAYDRDPDTNFAHELHTYGIYGQKDYNAWIGKLVCKRRTPTSPTSCTPTASTGKRTTTPGSANWSANGSTTTSTTTRSPRP
ncbi:hypothetical protein C1S82_26700, partial [Mycolicibacterium cosmeticum]